MSVLLSLIRFIILHGFGGNLLQLDFLGVLEKFVYKIKNHIISAFYLITVRCSHKNKISCNSCIILYLIKQVWEI